jgi:hypothetical protein
VSFAAINLCVASKRVFIVGSIYFVIDSVRKLLYTPSFSTGSQQGPIVSPCEHRDEPSYSKKVRIISSAM